jgi:zinc protease
MRTLTRSVALVCLAAAPAVAQRVVKLPPRPTPSPAVAPALPKVTFDSLPNGLRYAVVENHELPLVVVQTAVTGQALFGASLFDTPEKAGAWGVMLTALREGTTLRSAAQIADEIADLGTDMRFTTSLAFTPPSFRAARSTWRPSLGLLADVLLNPSFPAGGVDKVKSQMTGTIERLAPISLANRHMVSALYGAESPMTRFATAASVATVTRDDVVAIHQKFLRPQNFLIVITGDVTAAEARSALTENLGAWQRGTAVAASAGAPAAPKPTTIYLMDVPGLPQALLLGAQLLPGRGNADAPAIEALGSLLGDFSISSGSRFYQAFRLERGLSYSPSVQLLTRPLGEMAPLVASAAVPVALADTAVMTLLRVIRELKETKPATAGELDFSKRNLVGRLGGDFERLDLAGTLIVNQMRDGLPTDYTAKWIPRISALSIAEVQAAAAKYLDPDHMAIIVAGDRAKLEPLLKGTGLPVVIVPK